MNMAGSPTPAGYAAPMSAVAPLLIYLITYLLAYFFHFFLFTTAFLESVWVFHADPILPCLEVDLLSIIHLFYSVSFFMFAEHLRFILFFYT